MVAVVRFDWLQPADWISLCGEIGDELGDKGVSHEPSNVHRFEEWMVEHLARVRTLFATSSEKQKQKKSQKNYWIIKIDE